MSLYQAKNLVRGTLANSMTDSQTTIVLTTGHGARFPSTANGYYEAVIWDRVAYGSPVDAFNNSKAEIVLVTSHDEVSDTIAVIDRAEGGTGAITHAAGEYLDLTFSKTIFDWLVPSVTHQTAPKITNANAPGSGLRPTGYADLTVYVAPVIMEAQLISKVCFNVTDSAFGTNDLLAAGLWDSSKNLVCETGWLNVNAAGNKSKTLASTVFIKSGTFYVAWSGITTAGGRFYSQGYTALTEQPFINFDTVFIGTAANAAASGSAGDPAMPAALGTISSFGNDLNIAIVHFT